MTKHYEKRYCPFCGFRAVVCDVYSKKKHKLKGHIVICSNSWSCKIQPKTPTCDTVEEALEIWNERMSEYNRPDILDSDEKRADARRDREQ